MPPFQVCKRNPRLDEVSNWTEVPASGDPQNPDGETDKGLQNVTPREKRSSNITRSHAVIKGKPRDANNDGVSMPPAGVICTQRSHKECEKVRTDVIL